MDAIKLFRYKSSITVETWIDACVVCFHLKHFHCVNEYFLLAYLQRIFLFKKCSINYYLTFKVRQHYEVNCFVKSEQKFYTHSAASIDVTIFDNFHFHIRKWGKRGIFLIYFKSHRKKKMILMSPGFELESSEKQAYTLTTRPPPRPSYPIFALSSFRRGAAAAAAAKRFFPLNNGHSDEPKLFTAFYSSRRGIKGTIVKMGTTTGEGKLSR